MPKVFITQIPHKFDAKQQAMIQTVNIRPASEHGDIEVLAPAGQSYYSTAQLIIDLRKKLLNYDFAKGEGDSVIFMGDPAIMAAAAAILGKEFGRFTLLKWDRNIKRYIRTIISV